MFLPLLFSTKAKGVRYLELTEGYILKTALDKDNQVIGYQFVRLGKMMEDIRHGKDPKEAYEKNIGTYGRFSADRRSEERLATAVNDLQEQLWIKTTRSSAISSSVWAKCWKQSAMAWTRRKLTRRTSALTAASLLSRALSSTSTRVKNKRGRNIDYGNF